MPDQEIVKKLQEENAVLKKRMEESRFILAGIAHDFNQPLQAITGYTSLLKISFSEENDNLNELEGAVNFLESLAKSFLGFIKTDTLKNFKPNFFAFNAVDLLREALTLMRGVASKKQVVLSFNEVIGIPSVKVDPLLFKRLVINLLFNAIKFTPSGGEVKVDVRPQNREFVLVKISDTGCGIPYKELKSIFLKWEQGSNNKTEVGHGLGLAVCKQIMGWHGGRIWARSKGHNKGASFYFTLPVVKPV